MERVQSFFRHHLGLVTETDILLWFVHVMLPLPVEPTSFAVYRRAVYLGLPLPPAPTTDVPLHEMLSVATEWLRSIVVFNTIC